MAARVEWELSENGWRIKIVRIKTTRIAQNEEHRTTILPKRVIDTLRSLGFRVYKAR